jgi:S1-C subfamily serine protease
MKLYSRKYLLFACFAIAVLAAGLGVLGTTLFLAPRHSADSAARPRPSSPSTRGDVPALPVQYAANRSLDLTEDERNNIEIYERANKAVVYITTVTMQYTWFYQAVPQEGTGSGVIIDQQGHILTNYHVVSGADKISITLADGTVTEGRTVGADPENDLAVVQFNPRGKTLTTIPYGDSSKLRVGMKLLAIGNPFGLDRTLTSGIVSGLARPLQTENGFLIRETIQTDAAINPGNSGGPLLNSRGELVGINSAIRSPSGASAGVGFAIPVNTAKPIADELIRFGVVKRGWIDIDPVELFPQLVDYFNLSVQKGILINKAGASAQQAGLRGGSQANAVRSGRTIIYGGGDIITEVNGQKVQAMVDLYNALESTKPGEIARVTVMRGSTTRTFTVRLVEAPPQGQ